MQTPIVPAKGKEESKQRLLNAVGEILESQGYAALKINHVAKVAGRDKALIYKYFGGLDGLLEEYIHRLDFWSNVPSDVAAHHLTDHGQSLAIRMLQEQFDYVFKHRELQKVLLWRLSEERPSLRKLKVNQEAKGEALLGNITDPHFGGQAKRFRAVMAILISGIDYLNLYASANGSVFCGLDLKDQENRESIQDALDFLVTATYDNL